jgi:hypothetical protein
MERQRQRLILRPWAPLEVVRTEAAKALVENFDSQNWDDILKYAGTGPG